MFGFYLFNGIQSKGQCASFEKWSSEINTNCSDDVKSLLASWVFVRVSTFPRSVWIESKCSVIVFVITCSKTTFDRMKFQSPLMLWTEILCKTTLPSNIFSRICIASCAPHIQAKFASFSCLIVLTYTTKLPPPLLISIDASNPIKFPKKLSVWNCLWFKVQSLLYKNIWIIMHFGPTTDKCAAGVCVCVCVY